MKESKVLKTISYIVLPIIILCLIVSSFYAITFSTYNYNSKKEYFESPSFAHTVEDSIEGLAHNLIYAREINYRSIFQDGDNRIFVVTENAPNMWEIKNNSFLIIYENKVFTNLNIPNFTLDELRQTMAKNMQNQKYVSMVKGDIFSNSDYLTKYLKSNENYLKGNAFDYYTIENNEIIPSDISVEEFGEYQIEIYEDSEELNLSDRVYKRATIDDFEIYITYDEDFVAESSKNIILDNLGLVKPYKTAIYIAIPLSIVLLMIIDVYLINSIGYEKNKEGIVISDFDKVPFEIILVVFGICLGICMAILYDSADPLYKIDLKTFLTLAISFYAINIVFVEIIFVTFIKRIKAKVFLKTCLFGKVIIFVFNIIKKLIEIMKKIIISIREKRNNYINRLKYNKNLSLKFGAIVTVCMLVMFLFGIYLGPIGIVIDVVIAELFIAWFFARIQSFKKFEDALKQVSEGTLKDRLEVSDYSLEFKNSVEYLNNISNGFETAVEESMKSERLKTELITNVSHDIKTPLTSIINYVDLLKKENIENEKAKEYLDILDSKSQRLKRLTEDLVEASKASSGNLKLDLKQINIVELINQASGEFEDKFKDKKLEIITNFEKPTINIKADSRYMYRVIENLFSNVSKYALEGSRVYVDVKKENNEAKIAIKNISKERLNITEDELMQRFVRGDKSRTTEGSGLGLAIAKSLIVLQGGKFECKIDGDLFKIEITMKWI